MQNQLVNLLQRANLILSVQQQQQLLSYLSLLHRWNQTYNLTAVGKINDMLKLHILDSLVIIPWITGERFIDVGTGAGLPGIPLAIAMPDQHFTLLDSLGKRLRFLHQVQHQLGLKNISLVQSRVENYMPASPFDGVLSRAFASLADMLHWCQHLTDSQGRFYPLKGQLTETEMAALPASAQIEQIISLTVPELNAKRHLLIIRHTQASNKTTR